MPWARAHREVRVSRHSRFSILTLLVLINAAGCAGVREVHLGAGTEMDATGDRKVTPIEGAYVRLQLHSGERISGQVRSISDDAVVLERPRNHAFEERNISRGDIVKLEVIEEADDKRPHVSATAMVLLSVVVLTLAALAQIRVE